MLGNNNSTELQLQLKLIRMKAAAGRKGERESERGGQVKASQCTVLALIEMVVNLEYLDALTNSSITAAMPSENGIVQVSEF